MLIPTSSESDLIGSTSSPTFTFMPTSVVSEVVDFFTQAVRENESVNINTSENSFFIMFLLRNETELLLMARASLVNVEKDIRHHS